MSALGRLVVSLAMDTAEFEAGGDKAVKAARKLEAKVGDVVGRLGTVAAGAAVAVVTAAALSVKSAIEELDQINTFSERTGIASDVLQRLSFAAKLADVSTEELAAGLKKLTVNTGEALGGNKELLANFNALGISAAQLKNARPEQVFNLVADAVKNSNDSTERSAVLAALLGKNFETLVPLLREGSEGLRAAGKEAEQFGLVSGPEAVKQAALFKDNLDRLTGASRGFFQHLTSEMLPIVNEFAEDLLFAKKNGEGLLSTMLRLGLQNPFKDVRDTLRDLREDLKRTQEFFDSGKINDVTFKAQRDNLLSTIASLQNRVDNEARAAGFRGKDFNDPRRFDFSEKKDIKAPAAHSNAKQEADEFSKLVDQITNKNEAYTASLRGLTDAQTFETKLLNDIAESLDNLTPREEKLLRAYVAETVALGENLRVRDIMQKSLEAANDARFKHLQALTDDNAKLAENNRELQVHLQEVGLTADAIETMRIARLENALAIEQERVAKLSSDEVSRDELLLLKEKLKLKQQEIDIAKATQSAQARVAGERVAQEQSQALAESFARAVGDGVLAGMTQGGDAGRRRLVDGLKQAFANRVFEITIKPSIDVLGKAISKLLEDLLGNLPLGGGGFGTGNLDLGGFFAGGGRPPLGKVSVVGERGPELIVPASPVRVIPNNQIGQFAANQSAMSINYAPVYNIDSRSDRAQVIQDIERANRAQLAQLNEMAARRNPRLQVG